jgi:exonuclease VII small subunit
MTTTTDSRQNPPITGDPHLESALKQLQEAARCYNRAVGSYNTHLDNHQERRDLHDVPFRVPISACDAFPAAKFGERAALETLLEHLLDQAHLDSQLRRHPRAYPIHVEAVEHLELARDDLVTALEDALRRIDATADS